MEDILIHKEEYLIKANEYLCDWQFLKANRILEELLVEEPCCGEAHALMGELYFFIQKDLLSALRHFRLALQYASPNFKTYQHVITLTKSLGKYEEALLVIKKGYLTFYDKRDQFIFWKAVIYDQQRKRKKAKLYYKRALELSLNDILESDIRKALKRLKKKSFKKKEKRKKKK